MGKMRESILEELKENRDENYREFHEKLTTGIGRSLGVRIPVIRAMAKRLSLSGGKEWIEELMELSKAESSELFQEELTLWGMVIGLMKTEAPERARLLDGWVPAINSWAVCDTANSTFKFMERDRAYWYDYVLKYFSSQNEYELRFVVVTLMSRFMTDEYIDSILSILNKIKQGDYYVNMAVAWAISVAFVKYREKTLRFLSANDLSQDVQNKAIRKIRESLRVTAEDKESVLSFKK